LNFKADHSAAQHSPAAERNRAPILQVLRNILPDTGHALEIASGTGQHVAHFASHMPGWVWQPSDALVDGFESIRLWCAQTGTANVREPLRLDVMATRWPSGGDEFADKFDAIFCANMLHIAPWATCAALMAGASKYLLPGGALITYGPHIERDVPTSPGNVAFDESLRQRNPVWGIRNLEDVVHQAAIAELRLTQRINMPTNNLILVFRR
jgi:Protein of unknown function (DUF938)